MRPRAVATLRRWRNCSRKTAERSKPNAILRKLLDLLDCAACASRRSADARTIDGSAEHVKAHQENRRPHGRGRRARPERRHPRRRQGRLQRKPGRHRRRRQLRRPAGVQSLPRADDERRDRHPASRRHDPRHRQHRRPVRPADHDVRRGRAEVRGSRRRDVSPHGTRRPGGDRRGRHAGSRPSVQLARDSDRRRAEDHRQRHRREPPTASGSTRPFRLPRTRSTGCTRRPKRTGGSWSSR